MNSKERVWAALNREPIDRIPIHFLAVEGNICDQVLGRPFKTAFDIMEEMEQNYPEDWIEMINGIITEIEINVFSRAMETAAEIGIDTSGIGYIPFRFENKESMTDVFGRKYKIINENGHIFPYYIDGLIKDRKDWESFPRPNFKEIYQRAKKLYRTILRRSKTFKTDICIMAQDDFCSVFPPVWQGMGMSAFAKALRKDPNLIKERFEQTTEFVIGLFKTYANLGAKVFFEGADIAFKSGPLINPKYIEMYVKPCMKQVTNTIHEIGGKIIFHSDGDITSLLDFIVDCDFDAIHCLEPPYVDLTLIKKKVGDKVCLLGNIDTSHVLVNGTQKEVENAVKYAIKCLAKGGGYILSPSNSHPAMSFRRIQWMIDATKKYGNYPIKI